MTKINDPKNLGGKLFGYEIKYNNPENPDIAPGMFNGNIAEVDWNNGFENVLKRYNYQYDKLSRLTNAFYKEPTTGNSNYFDEYLTYDLNGNIKTLQRTAVPVSGTSETLIDNLEYKYTGNRLNQVIEHAPNQTGYEGGNNMIDYDLNGNMTTMKDKGIYAIGYNHLSLPDNFGISQANPSNGNSANFTLEYLYRADGTKVRKTYSSGGGKGIPVTTNITDYLDGFQYKYSGISTCIWCRTSVAYEQQAFKDPTLEPLFPGTLEPAWILDFVGTAEGFYSFAENRYIYQYLDHLGNARVSYAKNLDGVLQIIDFNNYYAFGMNHIGGLKSKLGGYQNYKYNGKEIQESGMYDYGARFYMPDIGRWGVVDPLAETSRRWSTYTYAYNNPIRFIDPDGRSGKDWYQKNGTMEIQYFEGSGEREGYTNVGTNPTVYSRSSSDSASAELSADGSATFKGKGYTDGDSFNVGPFIVTTGKQESIPEGFDIMKWLSNLGNNKENFFMLIGGTDDPDPTETMKKVKPGDTFESNDIFQTIFMFYGRNTNLSRSTIGFQDALIQFGLDVESLGNPFGVKNDTIYYPDYTFKKNSIVPIDTTYRTIPRKGETAYQTWDRLYKVSDSVKSSK